MLSLFDLPNRRIPIRDNEQGYPESEKCVLEALRALADVCDGATSWDGHGYNKIDSSFGKQLADQTYRLTPRQLQAAYRMLGKYVGQLQAVGLSLPKPDEIAAVVAEREGQYAVVQAQKQEKLAQPADHLTGTVDYENGLLYLKFAYNPQAVQKIHDIQSEINVQRMRDKNLARVQWTGKAWEAPMQALPMLKEAFPEFELTEALIQELHRREEARQQREREEEEKRRVLDARTQETLAMLGDLDLPIGRLDGNDVILYQHQREVIYRAIYKLRFLIAHDMGLGKTLSALCAAKAVKLYEKKHSGKGLHIFVIGQAVKRRDWLVESAAVGLHISYFTYEKIPEEDPGVPFILIADEVQAFQNLRAKRTQKFLALSEYAHAVFELSGTPMKNGRPSNIYPLLVAAHHPVAYPLDSKKTAFEKAYCGAQPTPYNKWDVSGATNLSRLNRLLLTGENACMEYKTKEECLDLPPLTRIKQQVEVSRSAARVYNDTVEAAWTRYEAHVQEKLTAYTEKRKAEHLEKTKEELDVTTAAFLYELDVEEKRVRKGVALVELGIIRHAGEIAKMDATVEQATDLIDEGQRPVIFCNFVDTAEALAIKLTAYATDTPEEIVRQMRAQDRAVKVISGEFTGDKRDAFIQEFQTDKAPAIVCTFQAGGAGINLQGSGEHMGSSCMLLMSRPWTPGDAFQGEARIHRIGQKAEKVVVFWQQMPETLTYIDVKIDNILEHKQKNIALTLQGKEEEQAIVFDPVELLNDLHSHTNNE